MVDCQRERDVRAIGVRDEMRWSGFQLLEQRSQVGNMSALRIDILSPRRSVWRREAPAVGDDPEALCKRLHLPLKRVEIPKAAVHEHERLSFTAFKVMKRRVVDLERAGCQVTCG